MTRDIFCLGFVSSLIVLEVIVGKDNRLSGRMVESVIVVALLTSNGVHLSAADWKTLLRSSVQVPIKSTSM